MKRFLTTVRVDARVVASTLAAVTPSGVGQLLCVRSARKGQGRVVLQRTEARLQALFSARTVQVLAWQPQGGSRVVDFYASNGYVPAATTRTRYYDDGETVFELVRLTKDLGPRTEHGPLDEGAWWPGLAPAF